MFFRSILKRIDWLHAWFGMTAGVLVLVVSWTGTIAVFHDVLRVWERIEHPVAREGARIDVDEQIRTSIVDHFGEVQPGQVFAFLPSPFDPNLTLSANARGLPSLNVIVAPGGDRADIPGQGPAQLITQLHTDFLMPAPYGVWLVGFSGIVALVLIVTGILLHRQIIRDLFAVRLFRSRRVALHDIHTIVGTWSLPFYLLLCFSGAVLGFISIASTLVEMVSPESEVEIHSDEAVPAASESNGFAETVNLNSVLDSVRTLERPFEPEAIQVEQWGTAEAVITVRGEPKDQLVWRRRASFDGVSGELINADLDAENAMPLAVYATMTPIHYGNFGGLLVRTLYFVLGVVVTFAMGVGIVLWINKRGKRQEMLSRGAIGLTAGCLVGTALVFPLDIVFRLVPEYRLAWLELSLWTGWLATFVLTLWYRHWARSLAVALVVCAALFVSAGLLSSAGLLVDGVAVFSASFTTLVVNLSLVGLGVFCWYCAKWTGRTLDVRAQLKHRPVAAAG